jgi:putative Mg2+ transporter-C (MgtC) family protein
MTVMPLTPMDFALRLASAFVAAFILGLDRGEHGHTVGLRTTLMVCIAACLAMLQADVLTATIGKTPASFAVMDTMRLPLGILSGIGFIGGGAILRRGNLLAGVTTAATLWFVTVIGLCFGGGQLLIGWIGAAIGLFILLGLRALDRRIPRELLGTLKIHLENSGLSIDSLSEKIAGEFMRIQSLKIAELPLVSRRELEYRVAWKASRQHGAGAPKFFAQIAALKGVAFIEWEPQAGG